MVNAYSAPAPVFDGNEPSAVVIGHATTSEAAMTLYRRHFAGTGAVALHAMKVTVTRRGEGLVDGWVPALIDDPAMSRQHLDRRIEGNRDSWAEASATQRDVLVNALVLAVTAPDDRVDDALELARAFASRLTPAEVERAKAEAEQMLA